MRRPRPRGGERQPDVGLLPSEEERLLSGEQRLDLMEVDLEKVQSHIATWGSYRVEVLEGLRRRVHRGEVRLAEAEDMDGQRIKNMEQQVEQVLASSSRGRTAVVESLWAGPRSL